MRKSLCLAAMLCPLLASWSHAQTAPGNNQLPPGPLIVPAMPGMAKWSIECIYKVPSTPQSVAPILANFKKLAAQDPAVAKAMANPQFVYSLVLPRPLRIIITKTGNIRHDQVELERDYKSEAWSFDGYRVEKQPVAPRPTPTPLDSAKKDFPEFDWINKSNFQSMKKVGPLDCLTFQQDMDATAVLDPESPTLKSSHPGARPAPSTVVAYIDVKTRYPVALVVNNEPRRYTILAAPTETLVVPEDFATVAQQAKAQAEAAVKPLSPP